MDKWRGTAVPNTGLVEKVYLNINLKDEEITEICSKLTMKLEGWAEYILNTVESSDISLYIVDLEAAYNQKGYAIINAITEEKYYVSTQNEISDEYTFVGWNPDFNGEIVVNKELTSEYNGVASGTQNELIFELFSSEPIIKLKLNLDEFLTDLADSIREAKGTTDKINAQNFSSEIRGLKGGSGGNDNMIARITGQPYNLYNEDVTELVDYAMYYDEGVNEIVFPNVTTVGKYALAYTTNLKKLKLENTSILKSYALHRSAAEEIDLPNVKTLETMCLSYLTIKNINIPNIVSIGGQAFSQTTFPENTEFIIPNSVTFVGGSAFSSAKNIKVIRGNSIIESKLTNSSFSSAPIEEIDLPVLDRVPDSCFSYCTNLKTIKLPIAYQIKTQSFSDCTSLESIELPKAKYLSSKAFRNCGKLKSAYLPLLRDIQYNENFYNCYELESVYTKASSLGSYGRNWYNCYSLKALIFNNVNGLPSLSTNDNFTNCYHILGTVNSTYNPEGLADGYIYISDDRVEELKSKTNWSTIASQIKPVTELPQKYREIYNLNGYTVSVIRNTTFSMGFYINNDPDYVSVSQDSYTNRYFVNKIKFNNSNNGEYYKVGLTENGNEVIANGQPGSSEEITITQDTVFYISEN